MSNLDFSITDPSSDWYSPAYQSAMHEGGFEHAAKEGRTDEITQFDRYRKINMGIPNDPTSAYQIHYSTKVPPWFFGKLTDQLYGSSDTNILPLNSARDPNYAYSQFARNEMLATSAEENWKMLANMPDSPDASEATRNALRLGIKELGNRFHRYSNAAEGFKIESMELQDAYNRQIGINNLRTHDAAANADAEIVEQDSRDFAMIDRGIGSGRLPATAANLALRETARLRLEGSMGNWDADLKGRGFAGPKGPYLLSGVPLQFLDDAADKAAFNMKRQAQLQSEKIKMFQSRYANDAPYRASVNQGLKAKVPGVIASGLGLALIKQKTDAGMPIGKAVLETAGDVVAGSVKFALWDRFIGPNSELNQGEQDFIDKQNKIKFVETLDDVSMKKMEEEFPDLRREKAKAAKELRVRLEESKEVESNITNSTLWNKEIGYDKRLSPLKPMPIGTDIKNSPANLPDVGYRKL